MVPPQRGQRQAEVLGVVEAALAGGIAWLGRLKRWKQMGSRLARRRLARKPKWRISGMVAPMTVEAATDGEIVLAYVEHFLCPELRPEDVVIMDNLSAHKVDGVRQLIEATGARLLYLPPYSPDLNPIEKA